MQQLITPDNGITYTGGWCLKAEQDSFGTDHPYPTAAAQWHAENAKHYDEPPLGFSVPIHFSIQGEPAGHIAHTNPDGTVASSSLAGTHRGLYIHSSIQDLINFYSSVWKLTYLGWGETVGTKQVIKGEGMNYPTADDVWKQWGAFGKGNPTDEQVEYYTHQPWNVLNEDLLVWNRDERIRLQKELDQTKVKFKPVKQLFEEVS